MPLADVFQRTIHSDRMNPKLTRRRFGFHAGFTGAALGLKNWAWQLAHPGEKLPAVSTFTEGRGYYLNEEELVKQISEDLAAGEKALGRKPTAFVLGALGRCGSGAVDLFLKAGIPEENITRWDINETRERQGPYEEIAQHDIFLNAVSVARFKFAHPWLC
jgi:saccharopine dehydrogenase (NAD+, L-lysine-forming)